LDARKEALTAFYSGPVWAEWSPEIGDDFVDFSNVRHFKPAFPFSRLQERRRQTISRSPYGAEDWRSEAGTLVAMIYESPVDEAPEFAGRIAETIGPLVDAAGGAHVALYETLDAENTFPRLSYIEGRHFVVLVVSFAGRNEAEDFRDRANATMPSELALLLAPSMRSRLFHQGG
jgi:hypothetical protein